MAPRIAPSPRPPPRGHPHLSPSIRASGDPGNDSFVGNFPDVNTEDVIPTASVDTFLRCVFGPVGTHVGEGTAIPGVTFPTPIIASAGAGTPVHIEDLALGQRIVKLASRPARRRIPLYRFSLFVVRTVRPIVHIRTLYTFFPKLSPSCFSS